MSYRFGFAAALLAALILSACEDSSPDVVDAEMKAAVDAAVASASQRPIGGPPPNAGGPPSGPPGGPPPPGAEGPQSNAVPDSIQSYKNIGGQELSAHIFFPEGHSATDKIAVMTFMHGGGLRMGSPQQGYELAERFTREGVALVSFQYRLFDNPDRTLNEIVADAKSSIRWLREHAGDLGIDPNRILMSGHSAGAYLALATGVLPGIDEGSENSAVSSVPNALILWSVPVARGNDPVSEGYLLDDLSPVNYLRDGLPPALFIHGNADTTVAYEPSLEFQKKYSAAGNVSEFHLIDGADHFFQNPDQRMQVFDLMSEFLVALGYSSGY